MKYFLKFDNKVQDGSATTGQNCSKLYCRLSSSSKTEELYDLCVAGTEPNIFTLQEGCSLLQELKGQNVQNIRELEIRNNCFFGQVEKGNEEKKLLKNFKIYTPQDLMHIRVIKEKAANTAKLAGYLITPFSMFTLLVIGIFFGGRNTLPKVTISGQQVIVSAAQNGLLSKLFSTPLSTTLTIVPTIVAVASMIITIVAWVISHVYYNKIKEIKSDLFTLPTTKLDEVLTGSTISSQDKQMLTAFRDGI